MRAVVTGGRGFLGWHLVTRLRAQGAEAIPVGRSELSNVGGMANEFERADVVFHLAGINRGADDVVESGNVDAAQSLIDALSRSGVAPTVVYANSVQAATDTPYGRGKAKGAELLAEWSERTGGRFADVVLPNVFGEGGRPHYNSFVATFCHHLARGEPAEVHEDRRLDLLHAQEAAQVLIDASKGNRSRHPRSGSWLVSEVLDRLRDVAETYAAGRLPDLSEPFQAQLFNTYRSHLHPCGSPVTLETHADNRGRFVEAVQVVAGQGQTSFSTTVPGITRGNHFHLRKVERFVVLSGRAVIATRPMGGSRVTAFEVDGSRPVFVDMPTLHTHSITNVGHDDLLTLFWTNELFDPADPDTYPEPVDLKA